VTLRAQPLTPEAFAPFGDVVAAGVVAGAAANQGTAVRFDRAARLASTRPGATPNLAVFRSVAKALPFEVKLLERHPCSSQAFLPMVCARYLVVVAPDGPGGEPDLDRLAAFVATSGQGINYLAGIWHHPIVALDAPADFVMLAWEDGGPQDCEERPLPRGVHVVA
jgi:ureidoglycolate lyase